MATELEGKPLKFTAIFESKDAEMGMDAFLKKIQDVNTKGVGNNASKAVNKASGQYQSILDGVTQSFNDFVNSNDRFYGAIAQSEMGLQKVRNEQGMLNKELKDGLVTEQEYINKTAQLNQMRQKLSEELKENKAQLQQFNSASKKTPAYTRQDTLNELASGHGAGTAPSANLSATDAFAKATQASLNKLNAELVELDSKLKAGAITNEQYAKSTGEINNKLKEVQLNQEYFNANAVKNIVPTEEIMKQKTALDAVSAKYREMVEDASGAFQSISPKAQSLNNNLVSLRQESANLQAAQKELSTAFQSGDITQKQYLESSRNLGIQQNSVKNRIAETRHELARIDSAERQNIGSIAEMTARLTQMKVAYDKLSESQRNNINVGGKLRAQYQDLSNQVAKLNKEMAGTKSEGVGTALGSIRSIASSLGIVFGAQQLIAFGKELFNIAQQAEGIQIRFARIGDTTGLEKLRAATLNTVSDLELMKQAIKADNFRIPMDVLAKGLEFATRRANETGESVEYLTQSFVTGLGRKSKLILDNLGISVTELNEEISRTGDFATSVGNIIDREMAKSGDAVDTLAVKTGKLSAEWELLKLNVSKVFSAVFNPGLPDYSKIEKLTQSYKQGFDSIKQYGLTTSDAFIKDTEFMLKQVNSKLGELKLDNKVFSDAYYKQKGFGGKSPTQLLNDLRRPLIEQQQALQASLAYAQGVTKELKLQDRQSKNIFSQSEIEEKLNEANTTYKNAIGDKQRAEAKKEVDKWQKLFDSVSIKANKTSDNKAKRDQDALAKEIAKDNKDREKLLEKWAETDAKYVNKQLSRNEQEVESVKNTYAEIKKAIEEHNKTTKGEKTSLVGFDDSVNKAINGVKERQVLDKKLENYKLDYDNYAKYEELKKTVSEKYADEQFKDNLDSTKNYYKNLNTEIAKYQGKEADGTITENEKQFLKERLKERKSFDQKVKEDNQSKFLDAIQSSQTLNDKLFQIEKEHQQKLKSLRDNNELTPEREKVLNKEKSDKSSQVTVDELTGSDSWISLFNNLDEMTAKQIDIIIKEIEAKFDTLKVQFNPIDLDAIRKKLTEAKSILVRDNPFAQVGQSLKAIFTDAGDGSEKSAKDIKKNWTDLGKSTEASFNFIADAINSTDILKDAIGEVGNTALMSMMAIASTAIAVSTAIKTAEKASVILAIISAALVVVQAIAGLFKSIFAAGDKRLEKSIQSKKEAVEELDRAFERLGRSINKSVGNSYYTDSQKQISNLKEQSKIVEQMIQDEDAKKKTDKGKMQDYRNQLEDIQFKIEDIQQGIIDTLVQTTFKDFASELGDALVSAFEEGENAIDSLNKTYDQFIKNAVINGLKMSILQKPIDEMIKSVSEYMKGNDFSLNGYDFSQWRTKLGEAGKDFTDALDEAYKGLGLEKDSSSKNTISGTIKQSISEAQANVLEGLGRNSVDISKRTLLEIQSQRVILNEQADSANKGLIELNQINVNTANTVLELKNAVSELQKVNKNLGGKH